MFSRRKKLKKKIAIRGNGQAHMVFVENEVKVKNGKRGFFKKSPFFTKTFYSSIGEKESRLFQLE
jgi:hypothetical protein